MHAFFTGRPARIRGDLRPCMEHEPRDQRFTFLQSQPKNKKYGRVSFEIHPVSNTESKCGILEEVLSSVSVLKGARKRWYVVLAEKDLYLFSKYCDARPKITINLRTSIVEWHNPPGTSGAGDGGDNIGKGTPRLMKVSNRLKNQNWLFSCSNPIQLAAWYNKVRRKNQKVRRRHFFPLFPSCLSWVEWLARNDWAGLLIGAVRSSKHAKVPV